MLNEWKLTPYNNILISPRPAIKCGKKTPVCNELICLDTETAHNHDELNPIGWVYQWCFSFQKQLVYGRKPSQLIQALETVCKGLDISENKQLVIYVHNLSYDIQYLKQFLIEKWGTDFKLLAVAPHKFITFEIHNIIFKCSYKLTNKSLAKFSKDMNVKHKKLVGAIDYDVIRYQDTPLTRNDWRYMFYDVVSMHESMMKLLSSEHDTLASVPLTSTGYVRRDGRNASRQSNNWHRKFTQTALTEEQYLACKTAFAGAITHGNRFYADKTVSGKIFHYDFRSHYPSQLRCKKYPVGKFNLLGENLSLSMIKPYLANYCLLIRFSFTNARLKDKAITCPYMQSSKVKPWKSAGCRLIEDNGRVLALVGSSKMWLTELDLDILVRQYEFESYCLELVYCSVADYLPDWFNGFIDKYYFEKTDFKNKVKRSTTEQERLENELSLMKSKNRLNGIYGMTATDIVRDILSMDEDGNWDTPKRPDDIGGVLEKYYKSRNNYLPYQWGVWTTAHARHELIELVELVGYDNFLYCDTDSIFFLDDTGEIVERINNWNKEKESECLQKGWYITSNEKTVVYHQFEQEPEQITDFRFLHAKCYAYNVSRETLKCVIAGVRDRKGKYTREMELGTIDRLTEGTIFTKMGGTRAIYTESQPSMIDGQEVASACIILPTTKTLHNAIDSRLEYYELMGDE